jgi:hypothetical protein
MSSSVNLYNSKVVAQAVSAEPAAAVASAPEKNFVWVRYPDGTLVKEERGPKPIRRKPEDHKEISKRAPSSATAVERPIPKTPLDQVGAFALEYFTGHNDWQTGQKALDLPFPTDALEPFRGALKRLPQYNKTCVIAADCDGSFRISQSGRPWLMTRPFLDEWVQVKKILKKTSGNKTLKFSLLIINPATIKTLVKVLEVYAEKCRMDRARDEVSHFTDANKIRGDFVKLLVEILRTRSKEQRIYILGEMQKYFGDSLNPGQWVQLKGLAGIPNIGQQDILSIVLSSKSNREQLIIMALCTYFCGEFKTALEVCREIAELPSSEKEKLPKTLGERLAFVALDGRHQLAEIPVCLKCHQCWPAFEALYWMGREKGFDLAALEKGS